MPSVHTQHNAFTSHVSFSQGRRQVLSRPFAHGCAMLWLFQLLDFPQVPICSGWQFKILPEAPAVCARAALYCKHSLIQQRFINLREMHSLLSAAGGNQDQLSKQPFAAHRHVQIPLTLNLSHFKYFDTLLWRSHLANTKYAKTYNIGKNIKIQSNENAERLLNEEKNVKEKKSVWIPGYIF